MLLKWHAHGFCELFKLGVPHLGSQVARPSDFFGLACHAFDTKWHAIVNVLLGMVSWRATPLCSSGTPIVVDESGVPRPFCVLHCSSLEFCISVPRPFSGVPCPYAYFESLLWTLVLACHAQLLVCHASAFLCRLLQVSRQFHTPSFLFVFYPIFDAFLT
ncbi:uncharacterized protein DS421_13g418890 [Arachis hypogaea]|nr:uncharacterized protein DS421_13g418890 [Arachis hypogaea]